MGSILRKFWDNVYSFLWNEQRIMRQSLFLSILIPFLLSSLMLFFELHNPNQLYDYRILSYTTIFIIALCYGGGRSALFVVSFLFPISLLFFKTNAQAIIYFIELLFINGLIFRFQQRRNQFNNNISVTERNSLAANLREKKMEDFVHIASHELKTPVTVIQAYLQLAEKKMLETHQDEYLKMTGKIGIQLKKLLMIIEDLSTTSQATVGKLSCNLKIIDINQCLKDCVDAAATSNPDFKFNANLKDAEILVFADRLRIDQVITNLLTNAIKYCGGKRQVWINCDILGNEVRITIKDTGIGIPAEKHSEIFSQFFRVESEETKRINGLGLGLYICRQIITLYNGTINFISVENEGCEFWFKLPLAKT